MKTINLRDGIYDFKNRLSAATAYTDITDVALDAIELLRDIQDILIGLTDEDWEKLNLDVEFILQVI